MIPFIRPALVESWTARGLRLRADAGAEETLNACSDTNSFGLLVRRAVEELHPRTVLDVGCGCGIPTIEAAQAGADEVHGIDIARANVVLARENVLRAGLDRTVSVHHSSWELLAARFPQAVPSELVVANPPYLPGGTGATVDGGEDGARLVRELIEHVSPRTRGLALLFGSVSNPLSILALLEAKGWTVECIQAHAVRFGAYTSLPSTLGVLKQRRRQHTSFFWDMPHGIAAGDRAPHAYLVLGVVATRGAPRNGMLPTMQRLLVDFQRFGPDSLGQALLPVPLEVGSYFGPGDTSVREAAAPL